MQGRAHFFVFHPTIMFPAVRLWNNTRIKEIPTQRNQYNAKKSSVILNDKTAFRKYKRKMLQTSAVRTGVCAYMDATLLQEKRGRP